MFVLTSVIQIPQSRQLKEEIKMSPSQNVGTCVGSPDKKTVSFPPPPLPRIIKTLC